MNTDAIFEKYWGALKHASLAEGNISRSTIAMALHLAIEDATLAASSAGDAALVDERDSWRALAEGRSADVADLRQKLTTIRQERDAQNLRIVMLEASQVMQHGYEEQQNRLMRWLIDNEPEASLACDADKGVAGVIIALLDRQRLAIANYDTALSHAQNEADMLRQQRASLQADLEVRHQELAQAEYEAKTAIDNLRADLVQARALQDNSSNTVEKIATQRDAALKEIARLQVELEIATLAIEAAASVDPTPKPEDWNRNHPAWHDMTFEERDNLEDLIGGAVSFRRINKQRRIDLVKRVVRHLAAAGEPVTGPMFDRLRPNWMPTAGAVVLLVESNKWKDLLALALEPTPA